MNSSKEILNINENIKSEGNQVSIRLKRNIKIDYIYKFLSSIDISSAVWVLYLAHKGMSLVEIGLLESIHHITSLVCEIPTGALADIMGRKNTIIIGRVMSAIGAILMLFCNSFIGFAIAFVISAMSYNLNSGSEEALVYDSLKVIGEEEKYLKINGNLNFIIEVAQGIAVLVGGILSDYSFVYSYVLSSIISICALGISFGFKEPEIHEEAKERVTIVGHFKSCFEVMRDNKKIIIIMMFFELIFMTGTTTHFYSQQYFSEMGYSRSLIAIIYVVASIGCAMGAKLAYKVEKLLKKAMLYIVPMVGGVWLIVLSNSKGIISVIGFIMFSMSINILYPVSSNYINKLIPSAQRATLISVQSICFSIFMIMIFPLLGFIGQFSSLNISFIVLAIILFCISIGSMKFFNRSK
ncbi:MFS transporter [Clostridium sp. UBA1056]|uniref:MFS transporter n=1 Tax=unclassified Clostridium TaxID=2614128 RepID=UPI0032179FD5